MNSSLQDVFKNEIETLVRTSLSVQNIGHEGLKGIAREQILSEFLRKYLPHQWGLGSGKIVDSLGNESGECDIVIYDRSSLPVTTIGTSVNIFPVEAVKYVIEVKSTLRIEDVRTTIVKFNKIKKLSNRTDYVIRSVLFAYKSDLKSKSELDRFKENDEYFNTDPAVKIILVVGKGYWVFNKRFYQDKETMRGVRTSLYIRMNPSDKYFEIARFLFAVLDTLNPNLPSFGRYFSPEDSDIKFYEEQHTVLENIEFIPELTKADPINLDVVISLEQVLNAQNVDFYLRVKRGFYRLLNLLKLVRLEKSLPVMEDTHSYPVVRIEISNLDVLFFEIKDVVILTSEKLMFFRGDKVENKWFSFGAKIASKEKETLISHFIGFPKRKDGRKGGAYQYKSGDRYGNHSYRFKSGGEMGVMLIAKLTDIYGNVYYSNEIEVSSILENEDNAHLDFLLYDMGAVKRYDKNSGLGMHYTSKGKLYDKRT